MTPNETRIVKTLLSRASAKGWAVSIYDGEAWTVKKAKPIYFDLWDKLATTDSDTLRFRDAAGNNVGSVVLIWGNCEDLISDMSCTDEMTELTAGL